MKFLKKFHWFEIILIVVVLGIHLYDAFSAAHNFSSIWFTRDDAYYYFKVAQNISEGFGSTFDRVNLTNGYHPLWMMICVPIFSLARFDLILPLRILLMVMALISAASSLLIFRLLKAQLSTPVAMLAAAFWAFSLKVHGIVTQQGMETGLVALSVIAFLYLLQKAEEKPSLSKMDLMKLGLAALFVLFSRLDGIYLALIGGIWLVFRKTPLRYLIPFDLAAALSLVVYGTIQRTSLKIYLLDYDSAALAFGVVLAVMQVLVFYFAGLYQRPKEQSLQRLLLSWLLGAGISSGLAFGAMLAFNHIPGLGIPRAVPLYYAAGVFVTTLLSRLLLKFTSPWNVGSAVQDGSQPQGRPRQAVKISLTPGVGKFFSRDALSAQVMAAGGQLRTWAADGLAYFGLVGAGLGTYWGFNLWMFGTPMPVSGQIKRWWGSMPNNVYGGPAKTVLDVFGLDPNFTAAWNIFTTPYFKMLKKIPALKPHTSQIYWGVALGLLLILCILLLVNRRKNLPRLFRLGIVPLLFASYLVSLTYGALAYSARHEWYWVNHMLALIIVAALLVDLLLKALPGQKVIRGMALAGALLCSAYLAFLFGQELIQRMPYISKNEGKPYMDTLPILTGYTEPGALIGFTGGGNTGYYIEGRTVVNLDGLINSYQYFQAVRSKQGANYLQEIGLDYVFANPYIISYTMPYSIEFKPEELEPVAGAPAYGNKILMKFKPVK